MGRRCLIRTLHSINFYTLPFYYCSFAISKTVSLFSLALLILVLVSSERHNRESGLPPGILDLPFTKKMHFTPILGTKMLFYPLVSAFFPREGQGGGLKDMVLKLPTGRALELWEHNLSDKSVPSVKKRCKIFNRFRILVINFLM